MLSFHYDYTHVIFIVVIVGAVTFDAEADFLVTVAAVVTFFSLDAVSVVPAHLASAFIIFVTVKVSIVVAAVIAVV